MRAFILVIDGFGIGAMPDCNLFGDAGANTLKNIRHAYDLNVPTLQELGLYNIDGTYNDDREPAGAYARLEELSKGKDTTVGHWEMAGVITKEFLPTFPNGFPKDFISKLEKALGTKVLCNKPYSGTEVIKDFGIEHLKTGCPIVYTSADSVLQIAVHMDKYTIDDLYGMCEKARALCTGKYAVGRVIARPFTGEYPFTRTSERKDYSLNPPAKTVLDFVKDAGMESVAVGKIEYIFNGQGITRSIHTSSNLDGLNRTIEIAKESFDGLVFVNLVDTDMKYGHRRDVFGYAEALEEIDAKVAELIKIMKHDDVLYVTGDHGCDPTHKAHTDHTREYTPLLVYGCDVVPTNLGTIKGFDVICDTIKEQLGIGGGPKSVWERITR
ncbi:MAG: phosphopentomutase [Corallococcus sp.]|nr:phosphopentomutase [Corallococcus sp.]MCM1359696.1 phosphopentomutase [Corallococcus sp.]MCM1395405.1 phosphopentomutase [Corallococcus sp.]